MNDYSRGYRDGRRAARDDIIKRMADDGFSHSEIAEYVSVSRQRVSQILFQYPG